MRFGLVRPCIHCPFRPGGFMGLARAPEIAESIFHNDHTFACHETVDHDALGRPRTHSKTQHCAGALILHEKLGRPNWRIRFAHRLGLYDPARLDMAAPVFDTVEDFYSFTRNSRRGQGLRWQSKRSVAGARSR